MALPKNKKKPAKNGRYEEDMPMRPREQSSRPKKAPCKKGKK